jgi:hypothetical protein
VTCNDEGWSCRPLSSLVSSSLSLSSDSEPGSTVASRLKVTKSFRVNDAQASHSVFHSSTSARMKTILLRVLSRWSLGEMGTLKGVDMAA